MNAILTTMRGERPLGATYWLWFLAPSLVLAAAALLVLQLSGPAGAAPSGAHPGLVLAVVAAQLAITFGMGCGVIRAALRSKAHTALRALAIGAAVIGMAWVPFAAAGVVGRTLPVAAPPAAPYVENPAPTVDGTLTPYQAAFLAEHRARLPRKIDELTRFETLRFDGTTLVYGYVVTLTPRSPISVETFKANGRRALCAAFEHVYRPGELEVQLHRYVYPDGTAFEVAISADDCGPKDQPAATPAAKGNFLTDFQKTTGIEIARQRCSPPGERPGLLLRMPDEADHQLVG